MSGDNGNASGIVTYVVKVERLEVDGETTTPICEGEVIVPDTEDIISLDDLIEAIKTHDLWDDGGEGLEEEYIQ